MPIQPYFPEPISVSGNVADAKHRVRVAFVRRVVGLHCIALSLVGLSAYLVPPILSTSVAFLCFLAGLVALTLVRRAFGNSLTDGIASFAILVPTLFALSQFLSDLNGMGWPVMILAPITLGLGLYALLCGNDFSYIGQFFICLVFTWATTWAAYETHYVTAWQAEVGALSAPVYLFYFVYDLSMLVKRRKFGEEGAAVADLFRDLLNFATYSVRVYLHWRKFRLI